MVKRKKQSEILESLFDAIPVNSTLPLSSIALKAELDLKTAKRYMAIIMMIQGKPFVYEEQIGEQRGYRRHTKAGRPPKR